METGVGEERSLQSAAAPAFGSLRVLLGWVVAFCVANLWWLLAVSVPVAAVRVAFTLWADQFPGLLWTALEFGVLAFRLGLVVVVVGLARGRGDRIPGAPVDWLPEVTPAVERALAAWRVVAWQLLAVAVAAVVANLALAASAAAVSPGAPARRSWSPSGTSS